MKILLLDENHQLLKEGLQKAGFKITEDYQSDKEKIEQMIHLYEGIVIRSRFPIDKNFINKAKKLKFIARVGAGLENIDVNFALKNKIKLINAPEGNRNAVGEHAMGLILNLFNKINKADAEVRKGIWKREENRGTELEGKTIGIIGYGNTGKSLAKKLQGFDVEVIAYDIKPDMGDKNARQVHLKEIFDKTDVLSLHVPHTSKTYQMVNDQFIQNFKKNFWLINTARGSVVNTESLVKALKSGKIKGAGLDVLEYEKSSFENLFDNRKLPKEFKELIQMKNVIFTPHIAGWTIESKEKLAQVILSKIKDFSKQINNEN